MRLQLSLVILLTSLTPLLFSCEPETLEAPQSDPAPLLAKKERQGNQRTGVTEHSRRIANTINLVKGDEWGNHGTYNSPFAPGIKLPVYPGADFQYSGRVNRAGYYVPYTPIPRSSQNPSQYWRWTIPWGNVYYPEGEGRRPGNLRVEIRNLRSYYFNRAQRRWVRIDFTNNGIAGAYYLNDFADDANVAADITTHPQGSISVSIPLIGNVFHFFRGGTNSRQPVDDPANCVGFYTACEARLVKANVADKRDNRNNAELYLGMGLDVWATKDADGNDPAFEYHQDAMFSRHRKLDANWRTYNGVALVNNGTINLDAYPPPLN